MDFRKKRKEAPFVRNPTDRSELRTEGAFHALEPRFAGELLPAPGENMRMTSKKQKP
jgi:hypothetical protein